MTQPTVPRVLGTWRQRVDPAVRRVMVGALVLLAVVAAHLARQGSAPARVASMSLLLGSLLVAVVVTLVRAHRFRASQAIVHLMKVVDRSVGLRIGRAARLVADGQARPTGTSLALAKRHLERSFAAISMREVERRAQRRAHRLVLASLVAWIAAVLLVLVEPVRVVEGWNVLFARHGRAPLEMKWMELEQGSLYPPSYLRQMSHALSLDRPIEETKGTVVVVRGEARFADREMLLTDGRQESPFVSDGEGRVTARLTLQKSGVLGVVVRFGEVRIWQPQPLPLKVLEDEPPRVAVDGGGQSLDLTTLPRITLEYHAEDDHGLWQIDLRLRSGAVEERRVLTKLDGIRRTEQGVLVLDAKDPFFERAYLPVVVTLLARDSNAIDGPHWGESPAVKVLVPELGDKEVARVRAILSLRKRLVEWLARELEGGLAGGVAPTEEDRQEHLRWLSSTRTAFAEEGVVPRGFLQLLGARLTKLDRASSDQERLLTLTDILLFVDSAGETVGERGTETVARSLAEISDQLSEGARRLRLRELGRGELPEVEMATSILASGARQLQRLGRLGRDLGEITEASMGRIARARKVARWEDVERASAFLAERLRHPTAAFAVSGSVGVESARQLGGVHQGRASEADTRFDRLSTEISDIAKAHAVAIEQVTGLVRSVDETEVPRDWHDDIRNHAETVRKMSRLLGSDQSPGAALSPLFPLREASLKITDSLDRMMLVPALEQLQTTALTLSSLTQNPVSPGTALDVEPNRLAQVAAGMQLELGWLSSQVESLRRLGSSHLGAVFQSAREREGELAERTEQIVSRESAVDAVLPDEVRTDLEEAARFMRDAERELEATRGPLALERQREAQRLLERSYVGGTFDDAANPGTEEAPGGSLGPGAPGARVPITPTFDAMGRETFRRMVQEGLGLSASPELRDAIERYTEGLLR
jgi:hypothetical protein